MNLNKPNWAYMSSNHPIWAKPQLDEIGLNQPKWAQMTLNIFKMILYELKIGLNELQSA